MTQGDAQTRDSALEEISRLNVLLSELLEQPDRDHQAWIWDQIMTRIHRRTTP